jgi:hypothetical protein
MKWKYHQREEGQGVQEYTFEIWKKAIKSGKDLQKIMGNGEVAWRTIQPYMKPITSH